MLRGRARFPSRSPSPPVTWRHGAVPGTGATAITPIAVVNPVLPPAFIERLAQHGDVRVGGGDQRDYLADARVVVTTPMDTIDARFIKRLPDSVGLIANVGVGTDSIDLQAAAARGIAVSGRALGILGLGAIGQAVARRAAGFGMSVRYWGPRRKPDAEADTGARWCDDLDALAGHCDFVSLHCPLTPQTRHLVDARRLARFKPGGILVNTGRGPLVDEAALVDALRNGPLGAAGLDVFEFEPKVSPGLLELDNVVLTPHIGSATVECRADMAVRVSLNIGHFLADGQPLDPAGVPA